MDNDPDPIGALISPRDAVTETTRASMDEYSRPHDGSFLRFAVRTLRRGFGPAIGHSI